MNPKQSAILRTIAEQVAEPAVSGRRGAKPLTPKQRHEWRRITDVVCNIRHDMRLYHAVESGNYHRLAETWKWNCQTMGIGVGWLSWFFWRWALPLLIELAKRWIEAQAQQDAATGNR